MRFNRGGTLYAPWGCAGGVQCDPVEKKPFFHAYCGSLAYSFGMLGCDLHCGYCQNWVSSQALRDPRAVVPPLRLTPEIVVEEALNHGARLVVSTYNEPLITSEWAVAIFKKAKAAGLATAFVSNGNATPQVLDYLRPWVDSTRWISKALTISATISSADACSRFLTPSAACMRWGSGWRLSPW